MKQMELVSRATKDSAKALTSALFTTEEASAAELMLKFSVPALVLWACYSNAVAWVA